MPATLTAIATANVLTKECDNLGRAWAEAHREHGPQHPAEREACDAFQAAVGNLYLMGRDLGRPDLMDLAGQFVREAVGDALRARRAAC